MSCLEVRRRADAAETKRTKNCVAFILFVFDDGFDAPLFQVPFIVFEGCIYHIGHHAASSIASPHQDSQGGLDWPDKQAENDTAT